MSDWAELAVRVKERAHALGFDLCGIAPAVPSAFKEAYRSWLARGYHGEMAYLARDPERRLDPALVLPDAQSIVVVGMNYYTGADPDVPEDRAIFARYARNEDYHDVLTPRLRDLLSWLREATDGAAEGRVYVDTGPILEREAAQRAGLGWFGKNTMLINTRRGSYFLLGELLLNLPLPSDAPAEGGCGTCTRCLDACPTGALVRPYELDARRCISYLTIEQKGAIPAERAAEMGNRVFGCDICQEVCPFNMRRAAPTDESAFQAREAAQFPLLTDLLGMTEEAFRAGFKGSPVKRAKHRGLRRNAAASLAGTDDPGVSAALKALAADPDPLVQEQAARSLAAPRRGKEPS